MPILPTTPSAKTFADAWSRQLESAVKTAAGRDGRLSVTEAKRISERSGGPQLFSDNAVNYLLGKGQQTVSVSVLVTAAHAYAEAKAAAVAGADGRVSYADAAKLPADLRDDFMYLRGKLAAGPAERSPEQLKADVGALAKSALDGNSAKKLAGPPAVVRGRKPIIERLEHPASKTHVSVWVADGRVYLSRASQTPSALVGWYDAGPVPPAKP